MESKDKYAHVWDELREKLPWHDTPEELKKRQYLWNVLNKNGDTVLKYNELEYGLKEIVKLPELFALKPVIKRAVQAVKGHVKTHKGPDFISKKEFRLLLKAIR